MKSPIGSGRVLWPEAAAAIDSAMAGVAAKSAKHSPARTTLMSLRSIDAGYSARETRALNAIPQRLDRMRRQQRRRLLQRKPAAFAKPHFQPSLTLFGDVHDVNGNDEERSALVVAVGADGVAGDRSLQSGFLQGFGQRGLLGRVTGIDETLGNAPVTRAPAADEADCHLVTATADRDDGDLPDAVVSHAV